MFKLDDLGVRSTILLRVSNLPNAKKLIDRLDKITDARLLGRINNLTDLQLQKLDELYSPQTFQLPGNRQAVNGQKPSGDFTVKPRDGKHDVYFDKNGYPDLEPYSAGKEYNVFSENLKGNKVKTDFDYANTQLLNNPNFSGKVRPSPNSNQRIQIKDKDNQWIEYVWHHHQDGKTLQPIRYDVHKELAHTGGGNDNIINYLKGIFAYE